MNKLSRLATIAALAATVHMAALPVVAENATVPAPAAPAAPAAPDMVKTETDKFSVWLDDLEGYFKDSVFHPRIVAHLITLGYSVNKAAKGKTVKGAASI
mgnify:CR=1 FL=1